MSDPHQLAQELSATAELARSQGNLEKARALFGEAADLERAGLLALPPGPPRSRAILALSLASLLFKAGLYDRAEAAICGFLGEDRLGGSTREQLRELLQITWEERLLEKEGLADRGAEIQVALRGGKVGWA